MRLMYENNIKEKRIRLNALMNRNVLISFDIDTTVVFNDYSTILFDKALFNENRSDLKSLDRRINLTVLKQESERQSLKPEFGVRFENMFGFGGQPTQYTLMAMVKLPF